MEIAESSAEGFVAATQNPVDNFAFAHDIEVVHSEITAEFHRLNNVGDKLHSGTGAIVMIVYGEGEIFGGEFFGDFKIAEAEFVNAVFVLENCEIVGETTDLVESPSIKLEITIT